MKNTYNKMIADVIENTSNRTSSVLKINSKERLNYLRFKSAINFLHPDIPDTVNSYNTYLQNRNLSNLEIDHAHYLEKIKYSKSIDDNNISTHPAIYCSFHMGSYISCCYYLVKNNIDFSIVIGADNFEEKKKIFMDTYSKTLNELETSTSKLEIINGQGQNSMISMIRNIKKGRSLFFYIDGSKGVKEFNPNDDNLVKIKFLNSEIYSRKGISFLAHYLKVPIIPVVSFRESPKNIRVKFLTPIQPFGDRDQFCHQGTQQIWDAFLEYFKQYPLQWESIYFAHQFIDPYINKNRTSLKHEDIYVFNRNRYEFYEQEEKVLFDKYNVKSIKLSKGYTKFLYELYNNNYELKGAILSDLIKNESSLSMLLNNEFLLNKTCHIQEDQVELVK